MRLNYTPSTIQQQPQVQQPQPPVQQQQTQPADEDIGFFSPKTTDKYSTFINMQQVANAALGRNNGTINEKLPDANPMQPANKGDRYDV
jgi:hypothetical protein